MLGRMGVSIARLESTLAIPSTTTSGIHQVAHVYGVRGRGSDSIVSRRCEIRQMASRDNEDLTPLERSERIKRRASELGFLGCGITDLAPTPHGDALSCWLESGMAGTMGYMHRQAQRRREPGLIMPEATRAVMVTWNHYEPEPEWEPATGKIACYARSTDYHETLRGPLERLADTIRNLGDDDTVTKAFIDAGPVPERELAQRAGIGWIGKNTMLIDPQHGSFIFVATILTNLDVAMDAPFEADRCGTCRRCIEVCPTQAFPEERVLDSRLCISYLTIEHRGPIDEELGGRLNRWVFGCDDCQTVCPWNIKFASPATEQLMWHADSIPAQFSLTELADLSDEEFRRRFGHTPLTRSGARRIREIANLIVRASDRLGE